MEKWSRIKYMPCLPLGDNRSKITGCADHIRLAREAAQEGIVLLKNNARFVVNFFIVFSPLGLFALIVNSARGQRHPSFLPSFYEPASTTGCDASDGIPISTTTRSLPTT